MNGVPSMGWSIYGSKHGSLYVSLFSMDHKVVPSGAREVLGIVGQDPSGSKSNQLHVDIFRFCFIHLRRYIL